MRWNVVQRDWLNIQIQTCTMLARSREWSRGMAHDHVTDYVVCRQNFILRTIAEKLTSETLIVRPYENLWRSPIGQSLDCTITGYKHPVHSF